MGIEWNAPTTAFVIFIVTWVAINRLDEIKFRKTNHSGTMLIENGVRNIKKQSQTYENAALPANKGTDIKIRF